MPINTLATAQRFTAELDKLFVQKSVTGFMLDNAFRAKFVGAETVIIPDIDFVGLADYDRDNGFSRGATTIRHTSYTLSMDRGRSIQIDKEDMDETGVANLAGKVLGEYVRTKVVPECDAYVLSKLYNIAKDGEKVAVYDSAKIYAQFLAAVTEVRDAVGYDEELIAFVDSTFMAGLTASPEISRQITVSDFEKGGVNFKVKEIDGVKLIPVDAGRMKSEYIFSAGADSDEGGFTAAADADSVRCLVMPKTACSLVKKHETLRIFNPEQNLDADAYKFDYRLHYDAFVKKSALESLYAIYTAAAPAPEQDNA